MRVTQETIQLAIRHTTGPGEPNVNAYRVASWLARQGAWSPFMMREIREFLGVPQDEIDPEVAGEIGSILEPKPKWNKYKREKRPRG